MFCSFIPRISAIALSSAFLVQVACAQGPSDMAPLKIIIGFPAGGSLDTMARALAEKLRTRWGNTVIVDNKPGAATHIALMAVKRSPADGSTILISPAPPFVMHPLTYDKLPFDPDKDLVPVAHLADTPLVATTAADSPYSSMKEYLTWIGKNPKDTAVGMVTVGGALHFGLLQLNRQRDLNLIPVAYKGAPLMLSDEIGGVLPVGMDTVASAAELAKAGKIKYLGVPGAERSRLIPEVATFHEQGIPGFENTASWYAAFVPAGTPRSVVSKLEKSMIDIVQSPEFSARMAQIGIVTTGRPGVETTSLIRTQREAFRPIVERSGFRASQ